MVTIMDTRSSLILGICIIIAAAVSADIMKPGAFQLHDDSDKIYILNTQTGKAWVTFSSGGVDSTHSIDFYNVKPN